ncbi:hypothetical protein V8G54_004512 [Vigna mungo]|uniref:Uncharacterized protein n=1 Tax=Vigna mungo TaxID=3915 RepID=A0AAQ3SE95_VIGMU
MLFGITSQDLLNPHIQLQHVIIMVSNLDVIQRHMEYLIFLITLKGYFLNIHLLPLMTPTKQLSHLKVVIIIVFLQPSKGNFYIVIVDEQSFRVVEGEGFKNLCR